MLLDILPPFLSLLIPRNKSLPTLSLPRSYLIVSFNRTLNGLNTTHKRKNQKTINSIAILSAMLLALSNPDVVIVPTSAAQTTLDDVIQSISASVLEVSSVVVVDISTLGTISMAQPILTSDIAPSSVMVIETCSPAATSDSQPTTETTIENSTVTGATTIPLAALEASTITSVSVPTAPESCTITAYTFVAAAQKSCKDIVLSDLAIPASSTLALTAFQTGGSVTFAGKTTFGTTANDTFDPVVIRGTNVVISGAPGSVLDGHGQGYWDGLGSNGGGLKLNHFIVVQNLNIQNWPTHAFYINALNDAVFQNILMDKTAGDAPNDHAL